MKLRQEIKQLSSLKVWQLIEHYYMKGFEVRGCSGQNILFRQMSTVQLEVLGDVVRMVGNFFGGASGKGSEAKTMRNGKVKALLEDDELLEVYRKSKKFIIKVV